MEKQHAIALSLNDLVFENRNKRYGAYQLRQSYENHLRRAAFIGTGIFVAVFLLLSHLFGYVPEAETITTICNYPAFDEPYEVAEIAKPEVNLPKPPQAKPVATVAFVELTPGKIEEINEDDRLTMVDELDGRAIGSLTQDGDFAGDNASLGFSDKDGGSGETITPEPAAETIFLAAEQMPAFPGGDAALARFLSRNLRFPASAQRNYVSGLVYVSFVISRDGAVTDVKILKGVEEACDAEAVRVVGKMPNWNPGRQNGRSVSVRYSIPIRFAVQ